MPRSEAAPKLPTALQRERGVELLRRLVEKSKRREQVPFAKTFLRSAEEGGPPLARLIQGGRGGEVRLKVFLTITMAATRHPYDMRTPPTPGYWAEMLAVAGAQPSRRMADALRWLDKEGFVKLTPRKGAPPQITLLTPQAPGEPGIEYKRPVDAGEWYISLPLELWTNGWIIDLPATSLALLMVIRDVQRAKTQFSYVPSGERDLYGLSSDTWTRGRNDLERRGLLEVKRVPQGGEFDYRRMRNLYRVRLERFGDPSPDEHELP
ncbi:hypothetical protein ACFV4N_02575 [Actinosynnema sp. NPDC059797]